MKVGVVGLGYWGPKLARCFKELGVLEAVCDAHAGPLAQFSMTEAHPLYIRKTPLFGELLDVVDAVAIATPPETHYALAKQVLEAGKHVFVEKPLTTSYADAIELEALAGSKDLALMTGHIYLHCPGIGVTPVPRGKSELYIHFLNPAGGPSVSTRDIMWAGLPHAASLALYFMRGFPKTVETYRPTNWRVQSRLTFMNGSKVFIDVGDFTGIRERSVALFYDGTRYEFVSDRPSEVLISRGGSVQTLEGALEEPLLRECRDFLTLAGDLRFHPYSESVTGSQVLQLIEAIKDARDPGLIWRSNSYP